MTSSWNGRWSVSVWRCRLANILNPRVAWISRRHSEDQEPTPELQPLIDFLLICGSLCGQLFFWQIGIFSGSTFSIRRDIQSSESFSPVIVFGGVSICSIPVTLLQNLEDTAWCLVIRDMFKKRTVLIKFNVLRTRSFPIAHLLRRVIFVLINPYRNSMVRILKWTLCCFVFQGAIESVKFVPSSQGILEQCPHANIGKCDAVVYGPTVNPNNCTHRPGSFVLLVVWNLSLLFLLFNFISLAPWQTCNCLTTLQWRHDGGDFVSNHQPHDCFLNRLFRRRSKKISKLRVTGLCAGNSPVTGEFPALRAGNAENVSIWWRHHVTKTKQNKSASLFEGMPGMSSILILLRYPFGRLHSFYVTYNDFKLFWNGNLSGHFAMTICFYHNQTRRFLRCVQNFIVARSWKSFDSLMQSDILC